LQMSTLPKRAINSRFRRMNMSFFYALKTLTLHGDLPVGPRQATLTRTRGVAACSILAEVSSLRL
jgi:hypothetical protein